jgi:Transposase/zinc-finger of transposase IS204/IS1001/IS1096/IS1165
MPTTPLFPLPEGLEMTAISETAEELLVHVTSHRSSSPCPQCAMPSSAIHSSYRRRPRDLPCIGRPIRLVLTVRKFFCRNPACARNVFTERLPDFIEASSRLTKRLRTAVQEIGFATCGKGGEQLSGKLGMGISDATMLCSLFLVPLPEVGQVRVVGVDDWSWRRGKRFGSLLVNLETHKIIDVLADREAESVKRWSAAHPEVEFVSRDRGGVYIDGATWGAPQARQVADRWHLLSNLGDAVEAFLIRAQIRLPDKASESGECQKLDKPLSSFSATPACQRKSQARLLRKWKLYERVQELHTTGMSLRKIGEELGLARNTVRKYFRQAPDPPLPTPRPLRASRLDPYEDYLLARWSQGERNAALMRDKLRKVNPVTKDERSCYLPCGPTKSTTGVKAKTSAPSHSAPHRCGLDIPWCVTRNPPGGDAERAAADGRHTTTGLAHGRQDGGTRGLPGDSSRKAPCPPTWWCYEPSFCASRRACSSTRSRTSACKEALR